MKNIYYNLNSRKNKSELKKFYKKEKNCLKKIAWLGPKVQIIGVDLYTYISIRMGLRPKFGKPMCSDNRGCTVCRFQIYKQILLIDSIFIDIVY